MPRLKGNRPRPRVALVGNFEEEVVKSLGTLFPTFWMAESLINLKNIVGLEEIDVIILSADYRPPTGSISTHGILVGAHVICFSNSVFSLPGPISNCSVLKRSVSLTEEYFIPELPLEKFNLLERDLASLENVRGLPLLDIQVGAYTSSEQPKEILDRGTLFYSAHTQLPFATIFQRVQSQLGIAWLPGGYFSVVPWVELICTEWARSDRVRFPNFGDWTKHPEWMTDEEIDLKVKVDRLTLELDNLTNKYKQNISRAEEKLSHIALLANNGKRRLITAQGNELLEEVAHSFEELGYSVILVDEELSDDTPKREDLRLRDPDIENWEAIVEVRGHAKSSGQTSDLNRLPKFAKLYRRETRRDPDKLIYIVNGQIELSSPQQRQKPFASAPDDVKAFGELDGLIIWTLDLFKLLKFVKSDDDKSMFRKELRESVGRWAPKLKE